MFWISLVIFVEGFSLGFIFIT